MLNAVAQQLYQQQLAQAFNNRLAATSRLKRLVKQDVKRTGQAGQLLQRQYQNWRHGLQQRVVVQTKIDPRAQRPVGCAGVPHVHLQTVGAWAWQPHQRRLSNGYGRTDTTWHHQLASALLN